MLLQENITNIRNRAEKWLIDTCTVTPYTWVSDGHASTILSAGTSFEANCMFLKPQNAMQDVIGEAIQTERRIPIMFAVGTDINKLYRITHGTRIYEVIDIEDTSLQALLKAVCREVA